MQHNPKIIAVDLSSIVKLDTSIKTLPGISVTPMNNLEIDLNAQDTIHYAIKAAKCLPLVIGQIAPLFYSEALNWLKHVLGAQFITLLANFKVMETSELKHKAIEKYDRIYYAFDKVEQDIPIWEENETEVLS